MQGSGAAGHKARHVPQQNRNLLEADRDGAPRGDRASPRHRRLRLRLFIALSVQAYKGWVGQRRLRQAIDGTRDLLEAACRNHTEDEGRDVRPASEGASARAQLSSQ
jgi:hypothetical protein